MEVERDAVDAVAKAGGARAVVEDVALVTAAARALDLGAYHAERVVDVLGDSAGLDRTREGRPAGTGVELVARVEERRAAARAEEDAGAVVFVERARERALGAFFTEHVELLAGEALLPLFVGEHEAIVDRRNRFRHVRARRGRTGPRAGLRGCGRRRGGLGAGARDGEGRGEQREGEGASVHGWLVVSRAGSVVGDGFAPDGVSLVRTRHPARGYMGGLLDMTSDVMVGTTRGLQRGAMHTDSRTDLRSTDLRTAPLHLVDIGHARVAHRVVGSGPDVVLVHGWPLHGLTWRDVVPRLAARYRCHVIDLPGTGGTRWTEATEFGLEAHARTLVDTIDRLGLERVAFVGHDSGAAIARFAAAELADRVTALVISGSEIPGHRPLLLRILLAMASLPGGPSLLRASLGSRTLGRSILGWGACFADVDRAEGEFRTLFVEPLAHDDAVFAGQMQLTKNWDWSSIDRLADAHARIAAPSLLIWGDGDPYFPAKKAAAMVSQLAGGARFVSYDDARLFVHEEHPTRFGDEVRRFFDDVITREQEHRAIEH